MSHNAIIKPRNVGIGAAAAPLLIVGAMVLLNSASDPRSSAADVQAPLDPETIIRPPMGNISEAQLAAMRFRGESDALAESDSPFPPPAEIPSDFSDESDDELPDIDPIFQDAPDFMVTAMIASDAGNIALINGKAHREGDELEDGWVITEIDAQAKQVVLEGGRGKMLILKLNRPRSHQAPMH